jgi:MFS family permease
MTAGILAPLRFRDFRLLWFGLLVSNLGTWMQFTAMGFFVSQLAGSATRAALYLGFIGAARCVPVLLLSPVAGVVADTYPRRRILFATNVVISSVALTLAVLAQTSHLTLTALIVLSAINSAANAFDSPVRQSWTPLLVDRPFVGNAIGLTSVAFNLPAVLGPALAGVLIVWAGVGTSFLINAVATLAVVVALGMMKPSPPAMKPDEPMLSSIRSGIAFLVRHRVLRWIVAVLLINALLTRPYTQLLPAYIVNALHGNAQMLGWAVACAGIGGFGGALVTAAFAGRERRSTQWLIGGLLLSGGVCALGWIWSIPAALPVIFAAGLGTLAFFGATNTLIQVLAPDDVRGRVVAVYTMIVIGVVPGGSLVLGAIASVIGLHDTFVAAGAVCVAAIVIAYVVDPKMRDV